MEFERRQHERQKLFSPEYFDMGAENGGMIVDISEDGLGFQAVGRVEKGAELEVSFSLSAGYRISARARIAWVGPKGNSGGTTFTRLPADSRSIIREWVTKTAEAEAAREIAAAVQAEITASETETEEAPLIIERIESPRAALPVPMIPKELAIETFVAAESLTESVEPPAQEAIQPEIPAVEPLATQPDVSSTAIPQTVIQQDLQRDIPPEVRPDVQSDVPQNVQHNVQQNVQPDVAVTAEPSVPSVVPPGAEPVAEAVAEPVIQETLQQNLEPLRSEDVQHDVPPTAPDDVRQDVQTDVQASIEPVSHSEIPSNLQAERDAPFALQPEAREEPVASPADTSPAGTGRADISAGDASSADDLPPPMPLSPGMPPGIPAAIAPNLSAQAPENKPRATRTPGTPPRSEPPRPLFPPRDTRELFSRSPWISGQSVPEEERSHKGLIAVIVICLIIAASVASVPYLRSHRQEIGERIEDMGRSVAGEPAQNAPAPSQQPSQSAQQPSQQTSQPSAQIAAPPSSAPSSSGGAISAKPSSAPTKPPQASAPSASTAAPAMQLHPSAPAANAGSGAAIQNPPVSPPLGQAIPPAAGSTGLLATAGQTEFKQAQKYLNGTGSVAADPAQAAELFWRSLEKGNTAAAIPLADLYLQGRGVSRSCLQARILLTAASNKGNAEAIQKLHELPENCE
ncbi:MAG: PilZ domain-containing protein [Candidatus Acidiferrales bacterium]